MGFQPDRLLVFLVDLKVGRPNSHELALVQVAELVVQDLREPDLVALVCESQF